MLIRTFHPIGQGAFYSERFYNSEHSLESNFNVVYDCGVDNYGSTKKQINQMIRSSFSKDEDIDILFISHFDFDHVSKIGVLKNSVKSIKRVVLPFLNNDEKIRLRSFYRVLGYSGASELVSDPISYFDEKTKLIFINESNQHEVEVIDNELPEFSLEEQELRSEIESGTKITYAKKIGDWEFIPFNIKNIERSSKLREKLKDTEFEVLANGTDIPKILDIISDEKKRQRVKEIYSSLQGNINENSMYLYSGPTTDKEYNWFRIPISPITHFSRPIPWYKLKDYSSKAGCIYTGDGDLNKTDISCVYSPQFSRVGTIQVPHHGSLRSFSNNLRIWESKICPISFGENNSYGHPSYKVCADISAAGGWPIFVSQNPSSGYIEEISKFN